MVESYIAKSAPVGYTAKSGAQGARVVVDPSALEEHLKFGAERNAFEPAHRLVGRDWDQHLSPQPLTHDPANVSLDLALRGVVLVGKLPHDCT